MQGNDNDSNLKDELFYPKATEVGFYGDFNNTHTEQQRQNLETEVVAKTALLERRNSQIFELNEKIKRRDDKLEEFRNADVEKKNEIQRLGKENEEKTSKIEELKAVAKKREEYMISLEEMIDDLKINRDFGNRLLYLK